LQLRGCAREGLAPRPRRFVVSQVSKIEAWGTHVNGANYKIIRSRYS
jgi:hypothetical protein